MNHVTKLLMVLTLSTTLTGAFSGPTQTNDAVASLPKAASQLLTEPQSPIQADHTQDFPAESEQLAPRADKKTTQIAQEGEFTPVSNAADFKTAYERGDDIRLTQDVTLDLTNKMTVNTITGNSLIIDGGQNQLTLAGKDSATSILSAGTGMNGKEIVFQNMQLENTNYWGVMKSTNSPIIVFNNVTYNGPQLLWVEKGQAIFRGQNDFTINREEVGEIPSMIFDGGVTRINHTHHYNFLSGGASTYQTGVQVRNGAKVDLVTNTYYYFVSSSQTDTIFNVDGPGSEFNVKFTNASNVLRSIFSTDDGQMTATNGGLIKIDNAKAVYQVVTSRGKIEADANSSIDMTVSERVFYGATSATPIRATNNSKIRIRAKTIADGTTYKSTEITAAEHSSINISTSDEAFQAIDTVPITATGNSAITMNSQTNLFAGTFKNSPITAGESSSADDGSTVNLSANATMFKGSFDGSAFKTFGSAKMTLTATMLLKTVAARKAEAPLFVVSRNSSMKVVTTGSLFGALSADNVVRYDIKGTFSLQANSIFDDTTTRRTFIYDFGDNSQVDISVTGQPQNAVLPFLNDSKMTVGTDASVFLRSASITKPLIQGSGSNLILVNRGKLEMEQSSQNSSVLLDKVKLETGADSGSPVYRRVQFKDPNGLMNDYKYIHFQSSFNGKTVSVNSNNSRFDGDGDDKFTNAISYLLIDKVGRPDLEPDDLLVAGDQLTYTITGTATPGIELTMKFLDVRGKDITDKLLTDATIKHVTVGADGNIAMPFELKDKMATFENFTIILEGNYPAPDQLSNPIRTTVRQYSPAIIELTDVIQDFDFGTVSIDQTNADIGAKKSDSESEKFSITDTRTGDDRTGVRLFVRQTQSFTATKDGREHVLKDSLYKRAYKGKAENLIHMDSEFPITEDDGLVLQTLPAPAKNPQDVTTYLIEDNPAAPGMIQANFRDEAKFTDTQYLAKLQWTLVIAP